MTCMCCLDLFLSFNWTLVLWLFRERHLARPNNPFLEGKLFRAMPSPHPWLFQGVIFGVARNSWLFWDTGLWVVGVTPRLETEKQVEAHLPSDSSRDETEQNCLAPAHRKTKGAVFTCQLITLVCHTADTNWFAVVVIVVVVWSSSGKSTQWLCQNFFSVYANSVKMSPCPIMPLTQSQLLLKVQTWSGAC